MTKPKQKEVSLFSLSVNDVFRLPKSNIIYKVKGKNSEAVFYASEGRSLVAQVDRKVLIFKK